MLKDEIKNKKIKKTYEIKIISIKRILIKFNRKTNGGWNHKKNQFKKLSQIK